MNETIQSMLDRRSIRAFKAEQIKEEELQTILTAGLTAPSANNSQPWYVTVIQNKEIIDWIVEENKKVMRASGNPEMVQRADDPKTHNFHHAPTVIVFSAEQSRTHGKSDCANLAMQTALAAHSIGLGSCYVASFMRAFAAEKGSDLVKKLQIPDGYFPVFALAVGYPDGPQPAAKPRKENCITYLR
ncbi:MAG: nitroreductase family protein [Negativicutes bacterium]|nr:nitroreductase family protein [Negativicutes bacterium]